MNMSGWGRGLGNYIPTFDQKILALLSKIDIRLEELKEQLVLMEKREKKLKLLEEVIILVYEQSRKNAKR